MTADTRDDDLGAPSDPDRQDLLASLDSYGQAILWPCASP